MDAYIFQGDIECDACGADRARELTHRGIADNGDSDTFPQGPYASGGGEADTPQHCGSCHTFLDNALTPDGVEYVKDRWRSFVEDGRGSRAVLRTWRDAYAAAWSDFAETLDAEIERDDHTDLAVRRYVDLSGGVA